MSHEHRVSVLVEPKDAPLYYRTWTGTRSVRAIHEAAWKFYREKHPGCRVSFGAAMTTNHYGAH